MISIGRKIYYLVIDGTPILDTGDKYGTHVKDTTVAEDYEIYTELGKYKRDAVDYIQLEYGQHIEDFSLSASFRVDVITKKLIFVYRDENNEIERIPLETRVNDLQEENQMLGMEQSEREIQQITLGQQLAEFEIRLLLGGM